jgi:hypothetical protein
MKEKTLSPHVNRKRIQWKNMLLSIIIIADMLFIL